MALTDRTEFAAITIKSDGVMEVRVERIILDGTEEIARQNKRTVYTPDIPLANLPAKVRAIANVVWTQAVIDAWNIAKAARS